MSEISKRSFLKEKSKPSLLQSSYIKKALYIKKLKKLSVKFKRKNLSNTDKQL